MPEIKCLFQNMSRLETVSVSRPGDLEYWKMERRAGIEPASLAWKAKVLPLHKRRTRAFLNI